MSVRLSLLKPTGHLTIGNYLGALRPMRAAVDSGDACFFGIADLHALTVRHDPAVLRTLTVELARTMVALGLGPSTSSGRGSAGSGRGSAGSGRGSAGLGRGALFVQSQVPTHVGLHYLLEATATTGELGRMIQFKEKGRGQPSTRAALFTYPVLMAADILLYDTAEVPVGDDQRQHVELARDLAIRFNHTYGETFVVPRAVNPPVGARVMDLQVPTQKMGKSGDTGVASGAGVVYLLDPPDAVAKKLRRAVTDTAATVAYDPERPGVRNLIDLTVGCSDLSVQQVVDACAGYGDLKRLATEAVLSVLDPLRAAYEAVDEDEIAAVFTAGAERALAVSSPVLARARHAIGL